MTGTQPLDPAIARAVAAEAWIWGYPLLENYRTLRAQAVDADDPRYVGGFGRFRHLAEPSTPANTDVAAPNNDTRYSWAWLDLRAEPWVVGVPATDRYYVLPLHELDTVYAGFIGSRTTGQGAGHYLVAGPGWRGTPPPGITGVIRADTYLLGIVGRTYLAGEDDVDALRGLLAQYRLMPLHAYTGEPAPPPVPTPVWPAWPAWDEAAAGGLDCFTVLDQLLEFFPVLPEEAHLRGRLASLGIDGGGRFDPAALTAATREAVAQGIADARTRLENAAAGTFRSDNLFGTRAALGDRYLDRAVAAYKGLYGLPDEEMWIGGWTADADGHLLDGETTRYTIRFPGGGLPPARFFWSATAYRLPERLLVENAFNRYAIGDRTPGVRTAEDGSLTVYVQHERPEDEVELANWLPAPHSAFSIVVRLYGPDPAVLDGSWTLPAVTPRPDG
ncbi:DUF1254 domain-containing protein [Yinghuangia soli]|uniref:DUF1254 domain-containing protein n=1 Tax=Yinghuangia soli TaxID=2908204 RepID=A0AA41U1J0_9ACTN|nr:DUF1254 domain-containing protein [Yinghuangia soli]MCF2530833.1 DUF1254 domain-containing protein [Yinghuangia soli]